MSSLCDVPNNTAWGFRDWGLLSARYISMRYSPVSSSDHELLHERQHHGRRSDIEKAIRRRRRGRPIKLLLLSYRDRLQQDLLHRSLLRHQPNSHELCQLEAQVPRARRSPDVPR